jgi:hypothetical protein
MQHECVRNQHLNYRSLLLISLLIGGYSLAVQAGGPVSDCSTYGPGAGTLEQTLVGGGLVTFGCSGTIVVPEITIASNTTIDADGQDVTLSGNNTNRIFIVDEGVTLDLNHVSIVDGEAISDVSDGYGGGIFASSDSTVTLNNATLSHNHAVRSGGGIYLLGGTVNLNNATVSENDAGSSGGGIDLDNGSAGTFTNVTVLDNHANDYGGGIQAFGAALTATNTTLSGNMAYYGGGIYSFSSEVGLVNSTVSGNTSMYDGGGIRADSGTLTLINATLSDNRASLDYSRGGGINTGADVTLVNTTLSGNSASAGGGLYYDGDYAVSVRNTIMTNSIGGNCAAYSAPTSDLVTPLGENLVDDDSCDGIAETAATGDGGINLGPLADNGGPTQTHALLPNSVAIDAVPWGDCTLPDGTALATDQRGVMRPQGDACDVGAVELEVTPEPPEQCDLNGNARFDLPDIVKFTLGCRHAKATWLCDYTGDGKFNWRDTILFVKNCHGGSDEFAAR